MPGPLSHIRVLDLSRVLAAPWTGQNFADLGAEVIKVERPQQGDDSRAFGPPWLKDGSGKETTESAYFACANRGKKSITVDLSKPAGQRIVRELAARCDVLLENYKFGDLARYGLGYDDLKQVNPRLVYCSVTGFGQTGPYRERPGYDFMIQGMAGLMSVTGERDDLPGGGPQKAGIPIADIMTGMYATIAVCAALAHRAETGVGQQLDLALFDSLTAVLANQGANYLATGKSPGRLGNAHPNIVPYQTFKTADGAVILACGNDNLFRKFCEVASAAHLAGDPRYATNGKRVENRVELTRILDEIFARRTTREWVETLEAAGVPNGPINTIEQVFAEPQAIARGLRVELAHPAAGKVALTRSPMRFSATPVEHERPPPLLGQHTDEILRGLLGLKDDEVATLRADGAV
jgi:crotonobetainyl-CoA:carnitine CoA-transferase CaiB-like acyl-CoA transferase